MKEESNFIQEATEKYGIRVKKDAKILVDELGSLFASGELNEEDKDNVFRAVTEMYWKAKDSSLSL